MLNILDDPNLTDEEKVRRYVLQKTINDAKSAEEQEANRPERLAEMMQMRQEERDINTGLNAQQNLQEGVSKASAAMGTVGGRTASSSFKPTKFENDPLGTLDIAEASSKPNSRIDPKVIDYLNRKDKQKDQGMTQYQKEMVELKKREQERREAESRNKIGGGGKPEKALTAEEGKNTGYYARATEAEEILTQVETNLGDSFDPGGYAVNSVEDKPILENMYDFLRPSNKDTRRKYKAAKVAFLTAALRKDSGAALTKADMEFANQEYFPVAGDTQAIIEQKRRNRAQAIKGITVSAGRGVERLKRLDDENTSTITTEGSITPSSGGSEKVTIINKQGVRKRLPRKTYDANINDITSKGWRIAQ